MGNRYVVPRKLTGIVPEIWRRRAELPFGNANVARDPSQHEVLMQQSGACRTVHICPRRQRGILGQGLGYVVISAVDVVVFLWRWRRGVSDMTKTTVGLGTNRDRWTRGVHLSGRCIAS